MKYDNNKYYTPEWLIEKMVNKIKELNIEISEILEPSAGDGRFIPYLKKLNENVIAYDIEPDSEEVIKQDFFELDIKYKKGRIVVGNPPFGIRGNLYRKFINKSTQIADYVVFILPKIQYNNNLQGRKRSSLIYSEDLRSTSFDTIDGEHIVDVCLNIYDCSKNDNDKYYHHWMDEDIIFYNFSKVRDKIKIQNTKVDYYINVWGYYQGKIHYTYEKSLMIGILIKNESLREDFNNFFETFYERYNDEIKDISQTGSNNVISKNFIQQKLKKDFYKK